VAIRRCPYCKAIIDESQKYCNNCGTQLLFPEDESEEEDVKGEKIVDDDLSSTSEDDLEESLEPAGDEAELEKEEIDLEDIIQGGSSLPDEPEEPEKPERTGAELADAPPEEPKDLEIEKDDFLRRAEEKLRSAAESGLDLGAEEEGEDEPEEKEFTAGGFEGEAQSEFDEILAELGKANPNAGAKTDLPPWAESARGDQPEAEGAVDLGEEEPGIEPAVAADGFAPGDTMDFQNEVMKRHESLGQKSPTIGIPESVTKLQEDLPFLEKAEMPKKRKRAAEPENEDEEEDFRTSLSLEEEEKKEEEEKEKSAAEIDEVGHPAAALPKLGFFRSLKALFFDLVFVAFLWIVAMALAAGVMNVGVFPLLKEAGLPAGLLFLALLTGYFFLFLFFLGETLGRRLAAPKD
jgi:hypothetical protein